MDKPELYHEANSLQKMAGLQCLDEYSKRIKWNEGDTVIDLGCADGGFTAILKQRYMPNHSNTLVACDISEKMVEFAKKHHGDETTTFRVWDIQDDVPQEFVGAFNHVFSFYTLHWIKNQEKAFQNIYDLLTNEGDCLLTIVGNMPLYTVYNILSQRTKWKPWFNLDPEKYVSPYHDMQDPDKKIAQMMERIGFKNIDVKCKDIWYMFDDIHKLKDTLKAVIPFSMPKDVFDSFLEDYKAVLHDLGIIKGVNIGESTPISFHYCLIVVYATK